jgi:hypothetical protein
MAWQLYHKTFSARTTSIHFHPSLIFVGNHRSGVPYEADSGRLQSCLQTLGLGGSKWKWQTLAYYDMTTIMSEKKFYSTGPWQVKGRLS